jgi:hypothetical protein
MSAAMPLLPNQQRLRVDEVDAELRAACRLSAALEIGDALLEDLHQIEQLTLSEIVQTLHCLAPGTAMIQSCNPISRQVYADWAAHQNLPGLSR